MVCPHAIPDPKERPKRENATPDPKEIKAARINAQNNSIILKR
jgi:hypothetical protein